MLPGGPTCLPEFLTDGEGGDGCVINLKDVRHPCLTDRTVASVVVPNDVTLGFGKSRAMLITGPNMGGKSTVMRSTCLAGDSTTRYINRLKLNRRFSHFGSHGGLRPMQLSQVAVSQCSHAHRMISLCIRMNCFVVMRSNCIIVHHIATYVMMRTSGCPLLTEFSLALEPVTKLCWVRALLWWKCSRPLRFYVTPPAGI
jgi:hypothetical protein